MKAFEDRRKSFSSKKGDKHNSNERFKQKPAMDGMKRSKFSKNNGDEESWIRKPKFESSNLGKEGEKQKREYPDKERESNYSKNRAQKRERDEDLKLYRHKVFVDGLPFQRSDDSDAELYDLCMQVGAKGVIRLVQKKGYGFGYLVFHTNEQAKKAVVRLAGQTLFGRTLRVEQPKAPNPSKATAQGEEHDESVRSIFQRQILLLGLPRFTNQEILEDALKDHFRQTPYENSVENIKCIRREKAFITFKPPFENEIQTILDVFADNPLKILGNTIDAVRALPPNETCGKQPTENSYADISGEVEDENSKKQRKTTTEATTAELDRLRRLTKSKKSYSFLLQELGDVTEQKRFREKFCEKFGIDSQDDVIDLSPVSTSLHGSSTGLWKVIVRRYLIAQKIFSMCANGKEAGKYRVEVMCE